LGKSQQRFLQVFSEAGLIEYFAIDGFTKPEFNFNFDSIDNESLNFMMHLMLPISVINDLNMRLSSDVDRKSLQISYLIDGDDSIKNKNDLYIQKQAEINKNFLKVMLGFYNKNKDLFISHAYKLDEIMENPVEYIKLNLPEGFINFDFSTLQDIHRMAGISRFIADIENFNQSLVLQNTGKIEEFNAQELEISLLCKSLMQEVDPKKFIQTYIHLVKAKEKFELEFPVNTLEKEKLLFHLTSHMDLTKHGSDILSIPFLQKSSTQRHEFKNYYKQFVRSFMDYVDGNPDLLRVDEYRLPQRTPEQIVAMVKKLLEKEDHPLLNLIISEIFNTDNIPTQIYPDGIQTWFYIPPNYIHSLLYPPFIMGDVEVDRSFSQSLAGKGHETGHGIDYLLGNMCDLIPGGGEIMSMVIENWLLNAQCIGDNREESQILRRRIRKREVIFNKVVQLAWTYFEFESMHAYGHNLEEDTALLIELYNELVLPVICTYEGKDHKPLQNSEELYQALQKKRPQFSMRPQLYNSQYVVGQQFCGPRLVKQGIYGDLGNFRFALENITIAIRKLLDKTYAQRP